MIQLRSGGNRPCGFFHHAHGGCVFYDGTDGRRVSRKRTAGDSQPLRKILSVHYFAAAYSAKRSPRTGGHLRDPGVHAENPEIVKGDSDGKSLIDAMRDGSTEGMQYFDGELEKLLRAGTIDMETCMSFATNPGNLSLQVTDLLEDAAATEGAPVLSAGPGGEIEVEIERTSAA